MKNYVIVVLLGIVVMAMLVISTPYILIRGAIEDLVSVVRQSTEAYMEGVEELLSCQNRE